MNGLNNDNYLVKFVVKWIAAVIHWCWRQDKMNYYTVFFWHCPQSNFKNVSENLCLFKSDNGSSKAGRGWFLQTNICIREGEICCWFMAASTLAGEAAGLEKLSQALRFRTWVLQGWEVEFLSSICPGFVSQVQAQLPQPTGTNLWAGPWIRRSQSAAQVDYVGSPSYQHCQHVSFV